MELVIKEFSTIKLRQFFHEGGPYNIETSSLICYANQWTGFFMIFWSDFKNHEKNLMNCHVFKRDS